jgi:uncharacterized lipoprotein YmbA
MKTLIVVISLIMLGGCSSTQLKHDIINCIHDAVDTNNRGSGCHR